MNPNLVFLNSFLDVSEETFAKLENISSYRKFEAGTQLVKPGEVPTKIYMLISGVMRAYLSSEKGKEFNKSFFLPFSFVGGLSAMIQKQPSKITYETLTACKVYEVNFQDIQYFCKTDMSISNLYNRILEHVYVKYEERQLELISLNATERYLKLCKKIPDLEKLIPLYQIASYLSITPVQLSRIRNKLKSTS